MMFLLLGLAAAQAASIEEKERSGIFFTCTSMLSRPGKWDELSLALSTFDKHNDGKELFTDFVVLNEYAPPAEAERVAKEMDKLRGMYPYMKFIQKEEKDKGQARSVNMIIDMLRESNAKFWMHWEESWRVERPFVKEAFDIMQNNHISTLHMDGSAWKGDWVEDRQRVTDTYREVLTVPLSEYDQPFNWWDAMDKWPMYSLSPALDRVDQTIEVGYFSEDPEKWPVTFEFEWAVRWLKMGGRRYATLLDEGVIKVNENHVSTYAELPDQSSWWLKWLWIPLVIFAIFFCYHALRCRAASIRARNSIAADKAGDYEFDPEAGQAAE